MNPSENYIVNAPLPYRDILFHLQLLVENTLPGIVLKNKWGMPFYYYLDKPFCYFNMNLKKKYVDVGFVLGHKIQSHKEFQVTENRKKMMSLRYTTTASINDTVLIDILNEAHQIILESKS
ncbi:MAG: DUF1801 domain-containing protein [Bizionia sp.]|nr:DUF1801 domain-containing protein [Bizionia sp.]